MKQGLIILKARAFDLVRARDAIEKELNATLAKIAAAEKEQPCEQSEPPPPQPAP